MTLPLFDEPAPRAPRQVTLIRLAAEIARSVGTVGRVAVEGEVYRPTTTRGGYVFMTLRDRAAQMDVKVPGPTARRSRLVAGERVSVVATLQWTPERGSLQLVAEEILPVGAGAIAAHIAAVRERLRGEGLLDRPRRRLPVLPGAVGVLCGTEAAVRRDIESVVAARCPGYPVVFHETTVSGPSAPLTIVEGIEALGRLREVAVVILARGGGDAPSLLPWSTEEVCRAVAACPVPVVSAIGHESDRPLCDEVADHRFGTPSLAATAVLPDLDRLHEVLDERLARARAAVADRVGRAERRVTAVDVGASVRAGLDRSEQRLSRAAIRLEACHPARALEGAAARLSRLDWRRPLWETLGRAEGRLGAERRHLTALSPQRTLDRGYAVVSGPDGLVVRRADAVGVGDRLGVKLAQGRLAVTVAEIDPAGDAMSHEGRV